MKRVFTLEQQIAGLSAAVSVGLVIVSLMATSYVGRQEAMRGIETEMAAVANNFADALDRGMFERFREIRNLTGLEQLRSSWRADTAEIRAVFNRRQATLPELAWLGFATPDGIVRASTRGMLEGGSVAQRPWFQDGLIKPSAGDLHEAKLLAPLLGQSADGEPFRFVDVSAPVLAADGSVVGVLGAHLSWTWAQDVRAELLRDRNAGDTAALILSSDGAVLLGPEVGQKPFSDDDVAAMKARMHGTFQSLGESGTVLNGFSVASGYRDYPGLGWIVVAQRPTAAAFARIDQMTVWAMVLGLVLAVAGVLIAWRIARRLTSPIRELTVAAGRVGRDPHATVPRLAGSREVGQLSAALRALVRHVDVAERQAHDVSELSVRTAERFEKELSALRVVADTDALTGLLNRRAFLAVAEDGVNYFKRYRRNFAILVVDIDFFKRVNDTYGHAAGDAVIRHVGETLGALLRTTDKVARFGGEEFVVLLREIAENDARSLAERMRNAVRQSPVAVGDHEISVSISVGVTLVSERDRDVRDVIERADHALYDAKSAGRNTVVFADLAPAAAKRAA